MGGNVATDVGQHQLSEAVIGKYLFYNGVLQLRTDLLP